MNEKITEQSTGELSEILLVLDKEQKRIQAVKGINKNGELQTVDADKKNQGQFMRVDKTGDIFSNFFSNFFRQLKNPTRFSFFKVPSSEATNAAEQMQKQVDTPTKEGEALMTKHEVKSPAEQKQKQNNMETVQATQETQTAPDKNGYRYQPEQVDWETMNNLGLSKERLEKANLLDPLLKGYKTNVLVPVSINFGGAIIRTDARLSLQPGEDGKAVMAIHAIRKEPNLHQPFFGHEFTKEDKDNLLKTGNMGRVVELTHPKTGEKIPSIVSIDRLTNEVIALRQDWIKLPDEIKGVKLDEQQKQTLTEGQPLYIEGMISKKGHPFDATVQYSADKRYIEFLFDRNNTQQQAQGKQEHQVQQQSREVPKTFRDKELTNEQYQKFKDGQTIYVDGLINKKGKPYQGYITLNKETGETDFSFDNPNKMKEKVQPAEAHKTQTAVNSEGKTNESTKNIKDPLKTGQQHPDSKKQQEQQKVTPPKKSRGIKR
jgi:hypothetical protein